MNTNKLGDLVHAYCSDCSNDSILGFNSVIDQLIKISESFPNAPFLTEFSDNSSPVTISYSEFVFKMKQFSEILKNTFEISTGNKVVVMPLNTLKSVIAICSILNIGATAVLLNPADPASRICDQITHSQPKLVICENGCVYKNAVTINDILSMISKSNIDLRLVTKSLTRDLAAIIVYTTGSTATSKGVVQSHGNLVANCNALMLAHNLSIKDRLMCCLPLYHVNGLEFTIFTSMIAGAHVFLVNKFDPFTYLRTVSKYEINIASLVPSMLSIIADDNRKYNLDKLDYFVSAASALSSNICGMVYKKYNKKIIQGYGLSETTNFSTLLPINISNDAYEKIMIESEIPTVGNELLGNNVVVLGGDGEIVPDGNCGEVCMRGLNVMTGYLDNEKATSEAFKNGWFHSGDLGKFISEPYSGSRMLVLTGRLKNIIKCGGQGVALEEVDRILLQHPYIDDAASYSVPDIRLQEVVGCCIVTNNDKFSKEQLTQYLSQYFSKEALPRQIKIVDRIPRKENGKVIRRELLEV